MEFILAFLMATASAYLFLYILCMTNMISVVAPPPFNPRTFKMIQALGFIVLAIVNGLASSIIFPRLAYKFLGLFYGFASISSFIGYTKWMAYWKEHPWIGSDAGQIGMAFWDLALSVIYFLMSIS